MPEAEADGDMELPVTEEMPDLNPVPVPVAEAVAHQEFYLMEFLQ